MGVSTSGRPRAAARSSISVSKHESAPPPARRGEQRQRVDAKAGLRVAQRIAGEPVDEEAGHAHGVEPLARDDAVAGLVGIPVGPGPSRPPTTSAAGCSAEASSSRGNLVGIVLAVAVQGDHALGAAGQRGVEAAPQRLALPALPREPHELGAGARGHRRAARRRSRRPPPPRSRRRARAVTRPSMVAASLKTGMTIRWSPTETPLRWAWRAGSRCGSRRGRGHGRGPAPRRRQARRRPRAGRRARRAGRTGGPATAAAAEPAGRRGRRRGAVPPSHRGRDRRCRRPTRRGARPPCIPLASRRAAQGRARDRPAAGARCAAPPGYSPSSAATSSARMDAPRARATSYASSTRKVAPSPSTGPLWSGANGRHPSVAEAARALPHRRDHAHLGEPPVDGTAELVHPARQHRLRRPSRDEGGRARHREIARDRGLVHRDRGPLGADGDGGGRAHRVHHRARKQHGRQPAGPAIEVTRGKFAARPEVAELRAHHEPELRARLHPRVLHASRHAATVNRQMRESRRAASRSIRDSRTRVVHLAAEHGGQPRGVEGGIGAMPARGPRQRVRDDAAVPPAPATLTMPIPVTTTRRPTLIGRRPGSRSVRRSRTSCSAPPPAGPGER